MSPRAASPLCRIPQPIEKRHPVSDWCFDHRWPLAAAFLAVVTLLAVIL